VTDQKTNACAGHRHPAEIIRYAMWLYFRFTLRFRDVEEVLASRGVMVTYEAIRQWMLKFGQTCANTLRRRPLRRGDQWHLFRKLLKKGLRYVPQVLVTDKLRSYGTAKRGISRAARVIPTTPR
jgi:putative transposase